MTSTYLNQVKCGDCRDYLAELDLNSIDLFLSDIPYGIGLDEWDVLHQNTNSAYLGQSPAQIGKSGFKRRGKPINGWSLADKNIGKEYQDWCNSWVQLIFPLMKEGASLFIFGARRTIHRVINAFEDAGFLLRDVLAWEKSVAHHRAQRLSGILEKRGLVEDAKHWDGWRLGNLAPIYEPIAWFFKPYKLTVTDNILENGVGAINLEACKINGSYPTNLLAFQFAKTEERFHEAQKPLALIEFLIQLTTQEQQLILDPFMGSGTTALAAKNLNRQFIGFEISQTYFDILQKRLENEAASSNENSSQPTLF